eukprot:CAMPEP_0172157496 /NCGR_PEP_ID=MMETSP1050-20130122/3821_1 /TAXON_ID=233186 /ORGANISM="Cryptomonas curvata, Strain CCAP979/52" /LENGTH=204 /DNA_ID=CAMNT_0012826727 /DNA_START=544 /DNA_END=1158 /DNA_ORIENTATION=+
MSPAKAKGKCVTRKYVMLSKEIIRKLGESVDSDLSRMKVALIPHSKVKQAVIVELVDCINEFLARNIPDGQIPPQIFPKTLSTWIASCLNKAGKWDTTRRRAEAWWRLSQWSREYRKRGYQVLWIAIYSRYHQEYNDKGQPKGQASVNAPDVTVTQYQGALFSAAEILDNDRVIVTGAREIREEAEERVDARKQLFLSSPARSQ